jgi:RNA polymerase sigma-70 factor (ECF subfamily)
MIRRLGKLLPFRRTNLVTTTLSDEALLAACATGDAVALTELFARHADSLYRFLGRLRGADARDLDDLLQRTFLEALRSIGRYRGQAAARTWLYGIAANVVRHHVRSEARRRTFLDNMTWVPERSPVTPAEAAERRQLGSQLAAALDDLKDDLRIPFVMCDVEGLPGTEVARALNLREGTLWRRLHEARNHLRRSLGEERR